MSAGPQIVPNDDLGFQPLGKKQAAPGDDLGFQPIPAGAPKAQPQLEGLAGPATGISAQPKQTFLERIQNVFRQGVPRYSTRTVSNPKFGAEQLVTPEAALSPAEQTGHPIATGAAEFAGGLTTPESLGFIAATGGLGELGGVAGQTVRRLASAGFSAQMLHSAYQQAGPLADAINRGDYNEAKRLATILGLTAATAGFAGGHAIGGERAAAPKLERAATEAAAPEPAAPEAAAGPEATEAAAKPPAEPRILGPESGTPGVPTESEQTELGFKPIEAEPTARAKPQPAIEDLNRQIRETNQKFIGALDQANRMRSNPQRWAQFRKSADRYAEQLQDLRDQARALHPAQPEAATPVEGASAAGQAPQPAAPAPSDYGTRVARLAAVGLRDPVERGYAQDYLAARLGKGEEPTPGPEISPGRAQQIRASIDERLAQKKPPAVEEQYAPDLIEEAKNQIRGAAELAGSFDRPGRYLVGDEEATSAAERERRIGITSSRNMVAGQFPWYADESITPAALERAATGKGSDYNRVLSHVADYLGREQAALAGPGTPAVGQTDVTGSSLRQLSDSVARVTRAEQMPSERISVATRMADAATRGRGTAEQALGRLRTVGAAMADVYRRPPIVDDYTKLKGEYGLATQKSALELNRFSKEMVRAIPDPNKRAAMGAWIEAAGNDTTLRDWAERSKGAAAEKYRAALRLTDAQKTIARNIQNFQDERAADAIDQGIMAHARENYLMHVWRRPTDFTRGAVNLIRTEMLQTNPRFARRRIFPTIFDGEQAGFSPRSADIGALGASHEHSLNEAIAARAFIKSLLDAKAADGRPVGSVSGSGVPIRAEDVNEAYLIRPHTLKADIRDYRPIDHPALRRWKWVANDSEGKPIYVQGDVVVHPDFYRDLKNALTRSALRAWNIPGTDIRPGAAALRLSQEFKNTLLAFAGFHQVQTGLHGLEHRINPTNLVDLDLDEPRQAGLVRGGLQVASWGDQDRFSEGLATGGLVEKIPGIGPKLAQYRDYLFQSYVPRLKMTMGLAALRRNEARYAGELSQEQIYRLTARESNAAFGELNYMDMGRNRTFQDVLRLALLAPDFLEARTRFVAQALKPYGREQLEALALGAITLYVGARIVNQILNGDAKWAPQDAFSIVYGGKAYVLRTVQGDLAHLLTDPRGFVYNRLNPLYGRGAVEAITGRDEYGRKRTLAEQARDIATGGVPIALQGYLRSTPRTLAETFLTSMGVGTFQYRSPAGKLAHQFRLDSIPSTEQSPEERQGARVRSRLVQEIRLGKATTDDLARALHAGRITQNQYRRALEDLRFDPLQSDIRGISLEQALKVWDAATPDERKEIARLIVAKAQRAFPNRTPGERARLIPEVHQILSYAQQAGR